MKKGQTESYSFLIGIIITVLILTALGIGAYQVFKPKTKAYFDDLTNMLKDLEEKETNATGELPFYVEEDEILLGFGKVQEYIGKEGFGKSWSCYGIVFANQKGPISRKVTRPAENCPLGKSCLCICKFEARNFNVREDACQGKIRCETFDKLELKGGEGCKQGVFIPGKKETSSGKNIDRGLASIYYSKQGNTISIDDEEAFVGAS